MPITYNSVAIRGVAAEPIIEEILFENKTIADDLVTFETDIKAETIFTETTATAVLQAYTCGVPSVAGSLDMFDSVVTPDKVLSYQEFCPETLRFSRFKRSMKPGAWDNFSTEFEKVVIGGIYAAKISLALEKEFWVGVKAATKTAIAALTPGAGQGSVGAAEQAQIAALTASQTDGVLSKMIYNNSNATGTNTLGARIKVAGTTITTANIVAEYAKVYAAIPAVVLNGSEMPMIYAPYSHKQMIVQVNNVPTNYTTPFQANDAASEIYYNGIRIVFVPLPENVMIAALKSHLIWATDLVSDVTLVKMDKIAANRDDMFLKTEATITAHVANQRFNVLYAG